MPSTCWLIRCRQPRRRASPPQHLFKEAEECFDRPAMAIDQADDPGWCVQQIGCATGRKAFQPGIVQRIGAGVRATAAQGSDSSTGGRACAAAIGSTVKGTSDDILVKVQLAVAGRIALGAHIMQRLEQRQQMHELFEMPDLLCGDCGGSTPVHSAASCQTKRAGASARI
jgi:hypothetical protein